MPARLLLADDSVTIQRVIELTFADEDVQVVAVGDGRAAIEQIQRERPDIVLADIGMPERDGYEVAAFLKGTPELAGIPVLLLTGAFEPVDETRARAAGCDGVLVKPFEPQMVIGRVKDLLAGRRPEGLWAAPSPQSPVRQAAAPADMARGGSLPPAQGASLEDYFDRLDAAFASLDGAAPAPPAAPAERRDAPPASREFAEDLAGLLKEAPAARIDVPAEPGPTLAEAFAALLAAERGQPFAPGARPQPPAAPPVSDEVVERIVRRVVAEMAEGAVRDTVLDVAERLVREEIARIKAAHPA